MMATRARLVATVVAVALAAGLVSCSREPALDPPASPVLAASASPMASSPPVPQERPFRLARMTELWAFTVDRTTYTAHGELAITHDAEPFAFLAVAVPMASGETASHVKVSPTVSLVELKALTNPQGLRAFAPVLQLRSPQKAGATVAFEVSAEWRNVPYVHGHGMSGRLLSLTFGGQPDRPQRRYAFAFPETSTIHALTDAQPVARRSLPGWKLFEYEPTSPEAHTTVHIRFDYGQATAPPPSISQVLGRTP